MAAQSFLTLQAFLPGIFLPTLSELTGYATEGALLISARTDSAYLTTDAVSTLRKVWVLITLRKQYSDVVSRFGLVVRR